MDNNVYVLRCRETGDAVLIDAANEHELLLELCRDLGVRTVLETHGHWDHIQAVPAVRDAGYEVGITAEDADMLDAYDYVIERRLGDRGRPAPPAHHPHARPHARLDVLPHRGLAGRVQRRHAVPGRSGQHQLPQRRLRHDHRARSTVACSPRSIPTRSCCRATATRPRSAPSDPTSRSGSTGAGSDHYSQLAGSSTSFCTARGRCGRHDVGQRDLLEHRPQAGPHRDPHLLQRTAAVAVVELLGPLTPHGGQRSLDGADDVGDRHLLGPLGQPVAALGAPLAADQSALAQFAQDVLQVLDRDVLVGTDPLALHGSAPGIVRAGQHHGGAHRVVDLGRDSHPGTVPCP